VLQQNIYYGEVLQAIPPDSPDNLNRLRYEYVVRAYLSAGATTVFSNVVRMEQFSGVDDYEERVLRSAFLDDGVGINYDSSIEKANTRTGDRVIMLMVGTTFSTPVIIGLLPHAQSQPIPNTTDVLNKPVLDKDARPQVRSRFNGFNSHIDKVGQMRLQHTGAPEIQIDGGYFTKVNTKDKSETTTLDFLSTGTVRLVDSERQGFVLSSKEQYFSLNNLTVVPSLTLDENEVAKVEEVLSEEAPKGQELRLSKKDKTLWARSSSLTKIVTGKDLHIKTFGNSQETVLRNFTSTVAEDFTRKIGGSVTGKVGNSFMYTVKNNIGLISEAGNYIFLDSSSGKEAVFIGHKTGASIVLDKTGSVKILGKDGSYVFVNAADGQITLVTKEGATVSLSDVVTISDATGAQLISLRDSNVDVNSSANVNVSGTNVNINAGAVSLGAGAVMSGVLGEPLMAWLTTHTHLGVTPVGIPIVPPPPTILSQSVKLKP
jgi:hypothetical protein